MGKVMINAGGGGGGVSSDETNVVASQVLSGKTYLGADTNDEVGTGTMPNRGTVSQTLNAGGSYTIPAGYHNGSGKVTANSLSSQTSGTAAASEILSGETAWVNGVKITGTMTNRGAVTSSLNAGGSYTIPAGYHNGSGKVTANSLSSQTSGTANASRILSGYTAWVNGSKITGSMTNQGAKTASLNAGGSYTIPAGYHNGSGKVTANSLSSQTSATAVAADILSGKTAYVKGSKITGTMGTMAGGTYTPSTSKQTISCSGKKMTSNITINAIPSSYVNTGSWTVFNNGTFSGNFGWVPQYVRYSKYYHPSPYDYSAQTMVKLGNIVYDDIEDGPSYGLPLLHKRNVVSGGPYLAFRNANFSTGDIGVSYPASGNYLMFNRAIDISKYNYVDITYAIMTGNQDTHLSFVVCPTDKSTSGGYEFFIRRAVSSGDYTYTVDLKDLSFATNGRDSAPTGQNFIMFGASHDGTANSLYRICLRKVVFRQ